ncbi:MULTISPECIES: hypothetical protein [Streptomyces]|uniref:hypothetical protein n=1 Tax=Streptomyces TaxID=1883 RepID=UPI0036C0B150
MWYDDAFQPEPVIRHRYDLYLAGDRGHHRPFLENGTREEAAKYLRLARSCDVKIEIRHKAVPDYNNVIWCSYCAARPVYWDYDCDGRYPTATCMEEQCEAGREEYRKWMGWA